MKAYFARIPMTGVFVRVPRWLYNLWPWAGLVEIPNKDSTTPVAERGTTGALTDRPPEAQ